jgi:hypothetical protein
MENLVFKKVWEDCFCIEIQVIATSNNTHASQFCYVAKQWLEEAYISIEKYLKDFQRECILLFGIKSAENTPAFSMKIFSGDFAEQQFIEIDLAADYDNERRTIMVIECTQNNLEEFAVKLGDFYDSPVGTCVNLKK